MTPKWEYCLEILKFKEIHKFYIFTYFLFYILECRMISWRNVIPRTNSLKKKTKQKDILIYM